MPYASPYSYKSVLLTCGLVPEDSRTCADGDRDMCPRGEPASGCHRRGGLPCLPFHHQQPRSLLRWWPCTGDWGKKPKPAAQLGPWQCTSAGQRAVQCSTHVAPTPTSWWLRGTSVSHIMKRSDPGAACSALRRLRTARPECKRLPRAGSAVTALPDPHPQGPKPQARLQPRGERTKHGLNQRPAGSPETATEDAN